MSKYVKVDMLRKMFIEHFDAHYDVDGKLMFSDSVCIGEDCEDIIKLVDRLPTVDAVEVAHAYYEKYDESEYCYCSNCGKPSATDENVAWHYYCPNCGSKMDGVRMVSE